MGKPHRKVHGHNTMCDQCLLVPTALVQQIVLHCNIRKMNILSSCLCTCNLNEQELLVRYNGLSYTIYGKMLLIN